MTDPGKTIDDWVRVHKTLMQEEKALAELALALARGEVQESAVEARHGMVRALRALADAVLSKSISEMGKLSRFSPI